MLKVLTHPHDMAEFRRRLPSGLDADPKVAESARSIVDDVRQRGDAALIDYTRKFDGIDLSSSSLRVPAAEMARAWASQSADFRDAIELGIERIGAFHRAQHPMGLDLTHADGARFRRLYLPLQRVGVYVPGGSAAYPSTVMMNVIPAQMAGVPQIVMTTPPARRAGPAASAILAVAHRLGVDEVYRVGGAQAIGALAYGTQTIGRVDKIVGPGNSYVNEAKRLVFGQVDIDSLAGPSEILVIADATSDPRYVAADLLSQAEHSPDAQAILVFVGTAQELEPYLAEVERQTQQAPRRSIIEQSLERYGTAVLVASDMAAAEVANEKAPEHLEILTREADALIPHIRTAGAVFVGPHTPEAVCDYLAGPNHVLPTGGTARFFSGLGTSSFLRAMNVTRMSAGALAKCAPHVMTLANTEGLPAHAAAIAVRMEARPVKG